MERADAAEMREAKPTTRTTTPKRFHLSSVRELHTGVGSAQDAGAAETLSMAVDVPTPTPATPVPGAKKQRNAKPKRVNLALQPGEDVSETRAPVDDRAGRRNKLGVCYHKPSNKWRAIVYMQRKQVNTRQKNRAVDQ